MLPGNLNEKQKEAILCENKRVLVLAGAGSGKTKTLIQKLLYLISEKNTRSSAILAITFTKNATNEMIDRLIMSADDSGRYEAFISNKRTSKEDKEKERYRKTQEHAWIRNLTVKTFHSLCYQLLKMGGGAGFDNNFKLIIDEQADEVKEEDHKRIAAERSHDIRHKVLIEQCKDVNYLIKLKRYILDFFVDRKHIDEKIRLKSHPYTVVYTTLKGEKVRSKSERDIADWLFRHNIKYSYEPKINLKDFDFKPDFHIPQADLYLEHVSDKSYDTKDKMKQFEIAGVNCVQTFESIMSDSNLFHLEMEKIVMSRITDTISQLASLNYQSEFEAYQDKVNEFLKTVARVHSMVKAEGIEPTQLLARSENNQHERVRVFYELAVPLMNAYKKYCVNKSYLDFDDLIIETINMLKDHPEIRNEYHEKFKYVMVDEFQDVNSLQIKLLDLLITPDIQLFCVGDDWQSIYGFRGSVVDYIVNFEKHYPGASVVKLDVNYRSTQTIVSASTEVIRKNKFQVDKEIGAVNKTPSKIQIYRAKTPEDGVAHLVETVSELQNGGLKPEDILVLYRRTEMYKPYKNALFSANLRITPRTIHASKGLEAKVVFIIGLTEGNGGFPDIWLGDALFQIVREIKSDMLMEEERRLFYVALTRAKDEVYLVTEIGNESRFISEIPQEFYSMKSAELSTAIDPLNLCPNCSTEIKEFYKFCPTCGGAV